MRSLYTVFTFTFMLVVAYAAQLSAQVPAADGRLADDALARSFYSRVGTPVFWYAPGAPASRLRADIIAVIAKAHSYGLRTQDYIFPGEIGLGNDAQLRQADMKFTLTLISFIRHLYAGKDIDKQLSYDGVSLRYKKYTDSVLLSWLVGIRSVDDVSAYFSRLEPAQDRYYILKRELGKKLDSGDLVAAARLAGSLNLYRFIDHFHFDKYIVVNIPALTLSVFARDTEIVKMKIVAGKPATRTPRFAAWCNQVILYPYWNVPPGIARKELLPVFKRSPAKVDAMNMQILNSAGKIVDPYTLPWSTFSRSYFPYTIRQCTGCDNALGVIKFNLTDPFNVYMHDTNYKLAFSSDHRLLSHGCIRVSQPIDLGNILLENTIDSNFLKACYQHQEPVRVDVSKPVPVFVIYLTAVATDSAVVYYRDVYHLDK